MTAFWRKIVTLPKWVLVQIFIGQPTLKKFLNLNGLTKIILLGLKRSHFLYIFWLLKRLKAAVKNIAENYLISRENKTDSMISLLLVEKLGITDLSWKLIDQSHGNSKQKHLIDQNTIMTKNWLIWTYISFSEWKG